MRRAACLALALMSWSCGGDANPLAPTPRTIPSVQGVWIGTWTRVSCAETGGAIGIGCTAAPSSAPLRLTLTQFNTTVQGTAELGNIQIPVSGPMSAARTLSLTGEGRFSEATVSIANWRSQIDGSTMSGGFDITIRPDALNGGTIHIGATQTAVRQ